MWQFYPEIMLNIHSFLICKTCLFDTPQLIQEMTASTIIAQLVLNIWFFAKSM